jgi:hypothetical protein
MHDAGKVGRGDRCERARATVGKHGRRALAGWLDEAACVAAGASERRGNGRGTGERTGAQGQRAAAAIGAASYLINSSTNQLGHWQYQAA